MKGSKFVYQLKTENNIILNENKNLKILLYHILNNIYSIEHLRNMSYKLYVLLDDKSNGYITLDELTLTSNMIATSVYRNISYDLHTDVQSFIEFYSTSLSKNADKLLELVLHNIINNIQFNKNEKHQENKDCIKKNNTKKVNLDDIAVNKTLTKISSLVDTINDSQIVKNTTDAVDTTYFTDDIKMDIKKIRYDNVVNADNMMNIESTRLSHDISPTDDELEKIKIEIEKLEKLKETVDDKVSEFEKTLETEQLNLSEHHADVNYIERQIKKQENQDEIEYNIFLSEKSYTYKMIYKKFFVDNVIKNWDCIPILFFTKFPVFLFLDGKDTNGCDVRKKILDTDDEFRLYKLLHSVIKSLCDENCEIPDISSDKELVNEFLNTLPPVTFITENQIMNSIEGQNDELFNNDETSMNSSSSNDNSDNENPETNNTYSTSNC